MNDPLVFIYGILFAATAGGTFALMWRITGATLKELDKPTKKRYMHPEMQDVKQGDELLVFKAEEDDKE